MISGSLNIKDVNGNTIQNHDVVKLDNGVILVVTRVHNDVTGETGLATSNNVIGRSDWLDVYPDGYLEIIGNLATGKDVEEDD